MSRCDCGALRVSHRACPQCGKYNGRIVVDVVAREKREARRAKKRQTELRLSGQGESGQKESKAEGKAASA